MEGDWEHAQWSNLEKETVEGLEEMRVASSEEEEEEEPEEEGDNVYYYGDQSEDEEENEDSGDEGSIHFGDEDDAGQSEYGCVGLSINHLDDLQKIDMNRISCEAVSKCDFEELELGYHFYCKYALKKGFAVRKGKVVRNTRREIVQQTLFCNRQGKRETNNPKKREPKPETRCGCFALLTLRIDFSSGRWYVKDFNDDHNHEMLEEKYCRMMAAHRKMTESDVMEMNSMRSVGISVPDIYASFASRCGGYDKVGFRKKDMYNKIDKQRRFQSCDAQSVLKYLRQMRKHDPLMSFTHTVDEENRLQHLFWCDGISQLNYQLFGDVLAFDATYGRNKYRCPLVIFSGVNHHNRTTVFGSAVVANETEDTYVWLLEQFKHAMKGKSPTAVITDGDLAMRNAIKKVFPEAHHRLCAWHLLRNATTNVGVPGFVEELEKCMFANVQVDEFCRRWTNMVSKFQLEENNWINDLLEKKHMWATAYITGQFFAGLRTTSRCESLHGQLGKFIKSRYNLTEFVQHFQRCLCYMRYKEEEDDFACILGEVVMRTTLQPLERSASRYFTRNIFFIFRKVLFRAGQNYVVGCRESAMCNIYTVKRYQSGGKEWFVSLYPPSEEFKCSCQRMESYGLPCPHIVCVLVYLDYGELPESLILERWTKRAKDSIRKLFISSTHYWDSPLIARYAALLEQCRELCNLAARYDEEFTRIREWITSEIQRIKDKYGENLLQQLDDAGEMDGNLQDPMRVRTKGCGRSNTSVTTKGKRKNKCSQCGGVGHNKKCCPKQHAAMGPGSTSAAGAPEAGSQPTFGLYVDLQLGSPLTEQTQDYYERMEHDNVEGA